MRIALLSNIHENLPALEACFKSMDEQKPDAIHCLVFLLRWKNQRKTIKRVVM